MGIPLGMKFDKNIEKLGMKLNQSVYGLNKSSANWFDLIKAGLESRDYHQYQVGICVFYIKDSVILAYVDDCVIVSHKQEKIISSI